MKKPHRATPVSAAQPQKCRPWLGPSLETVQSLASAPLGVEVQKYVQTVFECRVRQVTLTLPPILNPNPNPKP